MKRTEKEEFIRFIESAVFPAISHNYLGEVVDSNVLKRYIESIPVDKEDIKEIYAIKEILTGDIIWSARGSAYKEKHDVEKKLRSLQGQNDKIYKIITYKLEE